MDALLVLLAFVLLGVLAWRFGADSRDGFSAATDWSRRPRVR